MIYRFGTFTFDDGEWALTRDGRRVPLEPQPARALGLLLARAGAVVSRDELRGEIWGAGTHVDVDRGLAYCIGQLRAALGDSGENPRFVQTLPRRGFKFIAPVHRDGEVTPAALTADHAMSTAPIVVTPWVAAVVIAAVTLIVVAAGVLMTARDRPARRPIVAVAMFENETGEPAHDRVVAGLADAVVERLTAIGTNRVGVDGNAGILRRPREARDWRAVARDTGAAYLVSGQLQSKPQLLSLLVQLIRLDDGTHVWVQRIARTDARGLDTLDTDLASLVESAVRQYVLK